MTKKTVDKLLELKKIRKEELEVRLKEVYDLLESDKEYLKTLEELFKEHKKRYEDGIRKNILNIGEIDLYNKYFSHISKSIKEQKKVISERTKEVKIIRENLVEAYKDEKVLEKLLDKIIEEKKKIENHREQKEIDFLFLSRFGGK